MNRQDARKRLDDNAWIWFAVILSVAIGITLRYGYIQIVANDTYSKRFSSQFTTDRVLQSPRGTIYDRNGNPLALSVTVNSVSADPTMINCRVNLARVCCCNGIGWGVVTMLTSSHQKDSTCGCQEERMKLHNRFYIW